MLTGFRDRPGAQKEAVFGFVDLLGGSRGRGAGLAVGREPGTGDQADGGGPCEALQTLAEQERAKEQLGAGPREGEGVPGVRLAVVEDVKPHASSGESVTSKIRFMSAAASHVVELMQRVGGGVEQIRGAAAEQEAGNQVVYRSATTMREVAHQVRSTTEEQARGSGRIRESVEEVRDAVEQINNALQEQSAACRTVVDFLEEVYSRTRSNTESASRMDDATKGLLRQSTELRRDLGRFQV